MAVPFRCTDCGRCCVSLGRSITIERRLTGRHFDCREAVHGERFRAEVDEVHRGAVPARDGCPFLIWRAPGTSTCTCHASRPRVCREFRCARLRVCDGAGDECGRLVGRGSLLTDDPSLKNLWEELGPVGTDDAADRERIDRALMAGGYHGEWYD